ncbi:transposase [Mesorhizobium sp.]|uniref:IS66 family transposase n=1 Tax=Mesorhizobium sp. TaxID=1871066 RepID=UPI003457430F
MVATRPVDFRKGADGLAALVRDTMGAVHSPARSTSSGTPTGSSLSTSTARRVPAGEACGRRKVLLAYHHRRCGEVDPGRGRTKTGQLFAYARDDRAWVGSRSARRRLSLCARSKGEQPLRYLQGFVGILQVDGYAGYRALADRNVVSLAFCWSHVRRKFYELAQSSPASIATGALQRFAEFYKIDSDIRGRPADERRAARQQRSRPIIDTLELCCAGSSPWSAGRASSPKRSATRSRAGPGPRRFLDEGHVEIDSNVAERSIRPIALNRKNVLFAVPTAVASTGRPSPRS